MLSFTPIFIPGKLCTAYLFAKQRAALRQPGEIADTKKYASIKEMAKAALDQCVGPIVPIGLSMGGYVALEMARISPERVAGMALLSTTVENDNEDRFKQRKKEIELATRHKEFHGITRHGLSKLISPRACADDVLVENILSMAADIGRDVFVQQQNAIMSRRDQTHTLASFRAPVLVLCGRLDIVTPPALSVKMADLASDSTLCLLDGVGHLPSLEAPGAVTAALKDFFHRIA